MICYSVCPVKSYSYVPRSFFEISGVTDEILYNTLFLFEETCRNCRGYEKTDKSSII